MKISILFIALYLTFCSNLYAFSFFQSSQEKYSYCDVNGPIKAFIKTEKMFGFIVNMQTYELNSIFINGEKYQMPKRFKKVSKITETNGDKICIVRLEEKTMFEAENIRTYDIENILIDTFEFECECY